MHNDDTYKNNDTNVSVTYDKENGTLYVYLKKDGVFQHSTIVSVPDIPTVVVDWGDDGLPIGVEVVLGAKDKA